MLGYGLQEVRFWIVGVAVGGDQCPPVGGNRCRPSSAGIFCKLLEFTRPDQDVAGMYAVKGSPAGSRTTGRPGRHPGHSDNASPVRRLCL
jgi:hypothetical protein